MAAITLAGVAPGASAQVAATNGPDSGSATSPFATGSAVDAGGARAAASGRPPFSVVPNLAVTQTFTHGDAVSSGDSRFGSVTQLSPSVQVTASSGRVKGFLNYALFAQRDTNGVDHGGIQQSLNAAFNAEVLERRAFVDANANISLQPISALGPQYGNDSLSRPNRTEVRSYSVSPYLSGVVAGQVDYEARLSHAATHALASSASDSESTTGTLRFGGRTGFNAVDWSLLGAWDSLDYTAGRRTESDRVSAELGYAVSPQFRVFALGGRESSNFSTVDKEAATTHGYGFAWRPGNATSLSAQREHRAYGDTHVIAFSHRTPRTVWTFTDRRDISTGATRNAVGSLGSTYELLYALFASQQPDPALRAVLVNAYLRANGLDPNSQVLADFLTSAASSQRYQSLSAAWLGLRDTATLTVSQSDSRRVDRVASVVDDLTTAGAIRQQGATLNLAHRLTPLSSLSVSGSLLRTHGEGSTAAASRLLAFEGGWTAQLGRRITATLSARRSIYRGGVSSAVVGSTSSYTETALIGGLALRF